MPDTVASIVLSQKTRWKAFWGIVWSDLWNRMPLPAILELGLGVLFAQRAMGLLLVAHPKRDELMRVPWGIKRPVLTVRRAVTVHIVIRLLFSVALRHHQSWTELWLPLHWLSLTLTSINECSLDALQWRLFYPERQRVLSRGLESRGSAGR